MKRMLLMVVLLIDIIFIVILFLYFKLIYLYLYLFLNLLLVMFFTKKLLNINIINLTKIVNLTKTYKIRKKISKEEEYLKRIEIKTFDGSNGTTHPCIIKMDKLFNNYKYYLVHTPYNNYNIELENPSLCVSNDGINFIKPNRIIDPLLPIIKKDDIKLLKYYNDSFILFDNNELQIWYRYTEEDKSINPIKLKNQIYRITTKDGINFTKPELMIDNDGIWYLSPSIVRIKDLYYMYYFDKDLKMYCKTSKDLHQWNERVEIRINNFTGDFWHGEAKICQNKLYILFLSKDYNLYLCESNICNPLEFNICNKLFLNYYDKCNIYGLAHPYKSTFLIEDGLIILYIPFVINRINYFKIKGIRSAKWTMTYTKLKIENFNKIIKEDNK